MTIEELTAALEGLGDDQIKEIAGKGPMQKHIDRRVSGAVDTAVAKAKETPAEPTIEDREAALTRREGIASLAIEKGIAPSTAMALLGMGEDSSDAERLDMIVEYTEATETRVKDQILKEHVRNPRIGSLDMTPLTLEQIADLPGHVQAKLPPSVTEPALSAHIDKRKSIPTPRSDIRQRLFGGK